MSVSVYMQSNAALGAYSVAKASATSSSPAKGVAEKGTDSGTQAGSGAQISLEARIALAEKNDNNKDFTALSNEVRKTLDAQYTAGGGSKTSHAAADLSEMSGRALSSIILNKTGGFSRSEINAAKQELNTRTRQDVTQAIGPNGPSLGGLTAYGQKMLDTYNAISPEERQARGWTSHTRDATAQLLHNAAAPSLFDQLL